MLVDLKLELIATRQTDLGIHIPTPLAIDWEFGSQSPVNTVILKAFGKKIRLASPLFYHVSCCRVPYFFTLPSFFGETVAHAIG